MRTYLRILFGFPVPRGEFEGTAGEKAVYETACNLWRAAGFKIRADRFVSRTLGARVERTSGFVRRAAVVVLFALVVSGCGASPTEPTGPKSSVKTDCALDQKDMYGFCIPNPPTPTPTPTVPR